MACIQRSVNAVCQQLGRLIRINGNHEERSSDMHESRTHPILLMAIAGSIPVGHGYSNPGLPDGGLCMH